MIIQNLHQAFDIEYKEVDICPIDEHRHTFFELVYILHGKGEQQVNQQGLAYAPGDLFLILPQDTHVFVCAATTGFLFVRSNDIYLEGGIQKMEFIFHNASHTPGCILREEGDRPLVRALAEALTRESGGDRNFHREVIQQLVNTLITLVARNIGLPVRDRLVEGQSRQYITGYKLKLVESRLRYSDLRMGEIVAELGFTDESHLNRTFKKYRGMSPSVYRKQMRILSR